MIVVIMCDQFGDCIMYFSYLFKPCTPYVWFKVLNKIYLTFKRKNDI